MCVFCFICLCIHGTCIQKYENFTMRTVKCSLRGTKRRFIFWSQTQKALEQKESPAHDRVNAVRSSSRPAHLLSSLLLSHDLKHLSIPPTLPVHTSTLCPSFRSVLQFLSPFPSSPNCRPSHLTWPRLSAFFCFAAGGAVIKLVSGRHGSLCHMLFALPLLTPSNHPLSSLPAQ